MSFVVLHTDRFTTALTDDPVIAASDVDRFGALNAALAEAARLRETAESAVAEARAAGFDAGRQEGLLAGEADVRATLLRLAQEDSVARQARQGEIAQLALAVVRRIAGDLAPGDLVAGLAERATATIAPDDGATVRVHPAQVDAVRARLANRAGIAIEGDPTLADTDCTVETALGQVRAGLEVQLEAIERAWANHGD